MVKCFFQFYNTATEVELGLLNAVNLRSDHWMWQNDCSQCWNWEQITVVEFGTCQFGYGFMFIFTFSFLCHFLLGGILGSWPHICNQVCKYLAISFATELCYEIIFRCALKLTSFSNLSSHNFGNKLSNWRRHSKFGNLTYVL